MFFFTIPWTIWNSLNPRVLLTVDPESIYHYIISSRLFLVWGIIKSTGWLTDKSVGLHAKTLVLVVLKKIFY